MTVRVGQWWWGEALTSPDFRWAAKARRFNTKATKEPKDAETPSLPSCEALTFSWLQMFSMARQESRPTPSKMSPGADVTVRAPLWLAIPTVQSRFCGT